MFFGIFVIIAELLFGSLTVAIKEFLYVRRTALLVHDQVPISLPPLAYNVFLELRVELNFLTRCKSNLKSQLLKLKSSIASMLGMGEKTKDKIVGAVGNARIVLRAAASKALEAATAKVEVTDVAGFEILGGPIRRTTSLLTKVGKA